MDIPPYLVDDYGHKSITSKPLDIFHRNNVGPQSYDSCLGGTNDMLGELLDEN